jgi:hypothetical protein
MVAIPDVSADITNNANTGTEYALVSTGMALSAATAADQYGYRGNVWAIRTRDPERYPLTGQTLAAIRTEAMKNNSQYEVDFYHVTRDGLFVLNGRQVVDKSDGFVTNTNAIPVIELTCTPVTETAFQMHRVATTPVATTQLPTVMFACSGAPALQAFNVSSVYNYQLERFPTGRVTGNGVNDTAQSAIDDVLNQLQTGQFIASAADRAIFGTAMTFGKGSTKGPLAWIVSHLSNNPSAIPALSKGKGGLKGGIHNMLGGGNTASSIANAIAPGIIQHGAGYLNAMNRPGGEVLPVGGRPSTTPLIEEMEDELPAIMGNVIEDAGPLLLAL